MSSTVDHEAIGRANLVLAVSAAFLVVTWTGVAMRSYVRLVMIRNYGWDDAVLLVAVIANTLLCCFNILLSRIGFGSPDILNKSPATISTIITYMVTTFALYAASMTIVKVSIGMFYLRIAIAKWQKWLVYVTLFISTTFGTYYFFAAIFQCGNPAHFLANVLAGKCKGAGSLFQVNMTMGSINAASDLILITLPISLLRKAQMPVRVKIGAYAVVALGGVGGVVSLVRLKYIKDLTYTGNLFETGVTISVWSIAESGIAIIAASLATVRPMFRCCLEGTRRTFTPSAGTRHKISQPSLGTVGSAPVAAWPRMPRQASWRSLEHRGTCEPISMMPVTDHDRAKFDLQVSEITYPELTQRGSVRNGKVLWENKRDSALTQPLPALLHVVNATEPLSPISSAQSRPGNYRSPSSDYGAAIRPPRAAKREAMVLESAVGVPVTIPVRDLEELSWEREARTLPRQQTVSQWSGPQLRAQVFRESDAMTFLRAPSMMEEVETDIGLPMTDPTSASEQPLHQEEPRQNVRRQIPRYQSREYVRPPMPRLPSRETIQTHLAPRHKSGVSFRSQLSQAESGESTRPQIPSYYLSSDSAPPPQFSPQFSPHFSRDDVRPEMHRHQSGESFLMPRNQYAPLLQDLNREEESQPRLPFPRLAPVRDSDVETLRGWGHVPSAGHKGI